jgi:hypothetical protein
MSARRYIPALLFKILMPLIDPFLNLLMKGTYLKPRIVDQLDLRARSGFCIILVTTAISPYYAPP